MKVPSWFRKTLRAPSGKKAGSPRRKAARRHGLLAVREERLEERTLLAADFGFAFGLGDAQNDQGNSVATDAAGSVYVTGSFEGSVDFDPGPNQRLLTAAGQRDVFLAKYSPSGDLLFAGRIGGTGVDLAAGIAIDASGNIYIVGNFSGTADFDPGTPVSNQTSAGDFDAFVLKLDIQGVFVWASILGGAGEDLGSGIAVNASGVFTTGSFSGTADFDPAPGVNVVNLTSAGSNDVFVSKLNTAGEFSFARQVGGTSNDGGFSVAVDSVGNVIIGGSYFGTADFDPALGGVVQRTSAGSEDLFVLKLNASGLFVWVRTIGGSGVDQATDVASGPANAVYATGYFAGTVDFDPGAGASNLIGEGIDAFVLKLDSAGNFVWGRDLGGANSDFGNGIAVDTVGAAYTTGGFGGTADFDPGAGVNNLVGVGGGDIFTSKLNSSGDFVWAYAQGGASNDTGTEIAVSALGDVYTTGGFRETADFDPGPGVQNRVALGMLEAFVSQLTQSIGSFVWHDQDRDGLQDAGEPGLPGVRVRLFDSVDGIAGNGNDISLGERTTDANGQYQFLPLDTSLSFYLVFAQPIVFEFAPANVGSDDALDSDADPLTGRTAIFIGNQNGRSHDAGFFPAVVFAGVTALEEVLDVNVTKVNDQQVPSVASDSQGNFVVVWESFEDETESWDVFGQRYDVLGQVIGREFRVNTTKIFDQRRPVVAMADNGKFVVAWESPDGNATGVYARHYNANGQPFGGEFLVNTTTIGQQIRPTAAMDAAGNFCIAWEGNGTGDTQGIFARRYNAIGQSQGAEFRVNVNTTDDQNNPAVAMDADGDFVVAFERFTAVESTDVYARRFNAAGVGQGNEFIATNTTEEHQSRPAVAMDAVGGFAVSWSNFDLTDFPDRLFDIMARRFAANGTALANEFLVTQTVLNDQDNSAVAMDDAGRFAIAWWDSASALISARAYDANGQAFPDEFQVSGADAQNPAIAMDADGDFVVAWDAPDADGRGVFAQRHSVHSPIGRGQIPVNNETDELQNAPTVAMDSEGNYVVVWEGEQRDGTTKDVYAQRFNRLGVPQGPELLVNTDVDDDEFRVAVAMDADGDFVISWEANGDQDGSDYGVFAQRFSAAGVPQGPEFLVTVSTDMSQEFPSVAMDAAGNFVIVWDDDRGLEGDGNAQGIFGRRFNAAGMPLDVPGMPGVSEFQVNTFFTGDQINPEVAMDPLGNFVVTWHSFAQDGDGFGVFAQRYDAAGNRLGAEFQVNSFTDGNQDYPQVAMQANGGFLIAWNSNASGHNVGFAQRYNAAGVPQQGEFQLPHEGIAMDAVGNFIATFRGPDADGTGVYAQRYRADGTPQGERFRVNTVIAGNQPLPLPESITSVAMTPDGDFVIAWDGSGQGDNDGIFAQPFDVPLPPRIIIAPDTGNEGRVRVLDAQTGQEQFNFLPYGAFMGGVRVATGDVNGDGTLDIITAAGPAGGPHVRVFDGVTGNQVAGAIGSFFAYNPAFGGGVFVAAGDVNGDGFADVITGADAGGGPHVRVFSGATGGELFGFFAYSAQFGGGVRVASGDVDGDGRADIITAAGAGGGPHVRVFSGATTAELFGFFAYDPAFGGGVYVAAGDVNGDGRSDIITGAGAGGGPHVRVISGASGQQLPGTIGSFFAYTPDMTRGVRVGSVDANEDGKFDILAATGPGGPFEVRLFDAVAGPQQSNFGATGISTGGAFVAGANHPSPSTTPVLPAPLLAARGLAAELPTAAPQLSARGATVPAPRMDLSTVVLHDLAHLLGWEHPHGEGPDGELLAAPLDGGLQPAITPEILAAALAGL